MPGNTKYFCAKCGKQLSEDERPCSNCGCAKRKATHKIYDTVSASDNLFRAKLKDPNIPRIAYELTRRKKVSGKTKKPAEETFIIDRTHPEKTVKKHNIREKHGAEWKTFHDETEEFKAKRRKKK